MRLLCVVLVVAAVTACGDDGGTDDGGTGDSGSPIDTGVVRDGSGPPDAPGVDAPGTDAPGSDTGGMDAATDDSGACGCVEQAVTWALVGGLSFFERTSEITPCRDFELTQMDRMGGTMTCTNEVPCLGDAITIDDVRGALADDDVVAAFTDAEGMGGRVLYGRDMRPVDAPLFEVTVDGNTIAVGGMCTGGSGCTPIPPGVDALRDLLQALTTERLAEEDCASTFPGG